MKKVLVAMSGGVDSSVAAMLLKEQGYEVVGATMRLWHANDDKKRPGGCCSIEDISDAKCVCNALNIAHYVFNFESEFKKFIVDNFVKEYFCARTPNPCIICNQKMKFEIFLQRAIAMGFDYIATGHYANVERAQHLRLKKSTDKTKDQSYALFRLDEKKLEKILFPLGELSKKEVRQIAQNANLPVAQKPDSQEICFIDNNDYGTFLKNYDPLTKIEKGDILDKSGKKLGVHKGLAYYTVGQCSGLGLSTPEPRYVLSINSENNTLVVGKKEDTYSKICFVKDVSWVNAKPENNFIADVKIRYLHTAAHAQIKSKENNCVQIIFCEPQMAITPGQSAVFYDGEYVLGGGVIVKNNENM